MPKNAVAMPWIAFLAGVMAIAGGCGSSPVESVALDPPRITLVEPKNRARFKPGEAIKFSGVVDARGSDGISGMVIVEIARDKRWSDSFDSYATPIIRSEATGAYSFEATRTAPPRPGTYHARARSNIPDRAGGPVSHGAASKEPISSPFIEIEVRK